ncbi:MAG: hypothetical protein U0354_07260 [Candidatus Sericytochromatia bacterium]
MEIPKSLETAWKNVSKDKTIDKADYDLLIKAASPNGKDEELDQEEVNFLTKLKSELEQKGGAKGSVPVDGLNFAQTTPAKIIKESDIGDVPETLRNTWNAAIEDGTIDADDYRTLMDVAAPNWSDEELDDKEKAFLGNLQALLKSTGQNLTIEKKSSQPQSNEVPKTEENKEEPKSENADYPRSTPEVNTETDDSLKSLNEVNNILDALGDDPDFAPLRTIVNQRLSNSTSAKKFSAEVNQIISEIEPGKVASMNQGKARLKTLYDNLPAGVKANPQITNLYTHAMGTLDSQINTSTNKKNPKTNTTNSTSTTNKPSTQTTPKINVPKDLKATWDVVAADGKIDKNDYARLLKAASPNGKDEELDQEEVKFLTDLKQKVDNEQGIYSFVDDAEDTTEDIPDKVVAPLVELGEPPDSLKPQIEVLLQKGFIDNDDFNELVSLAAPNGKDEEFDSQEQEYLFKLKEKVEQSGGKLYLDPNHQEKPIKTTGKPMLLNWTGYTEENKGALKNAFGNSVSGGNMPILKASEALKVAKAFGVSNIKQLQQLVKAKVDGQFGPETFFKAKVYIANEMNKPNADIQKLGQMLNSLGNDDEVEAMKAKLGLPSNSTPHTEENEDEMTDLSLDNEDNGTQQTQSKPQTQSNSKTQSTSNDDGVPKTLKATWDKVTADGNLTKADFDLLMKAASPNKKNSEFDNDELEFLATIKDMFAKGKTDVLELRKPQSSKPTQQTQSKPQTTQKPVTVSVKNFNPPQTLKATWAKAISDGKITNADFEALMKAAAPNKKNVEFENEEIEFLANLREKIKAAGGTLNISK